MYCKVKTEPNFASYFICSPILVLINFSPYNNQEFYNLVILLAPFYEENQASYPHFLLFVTIDLKKKKNKINKLSILSIWPNI
jgi:hypothetical protein